MARPQMTAILELLKPMTWFPPMWAFGCGVVSAGPLSGRTMARRSSTGVILAGPLVCATSQAVNDWFDRHVDAINEPQRPIPSGRMPGTLGPPHRHDLDVAVRWSSRRRSGTYVLVAAIVGPGAGLGLQRAAARG